MITIQGNFPIWICDQETFLRNSGNLGRCHLINFQNIKWGKEMLCFHRFYEWKDSIYSFIYLMNKLCQVQVLGVELYIKTGRSLIF